MRLKIIAKTPEPKHSYMKYKVFSGKIAKVINADTGEEVENITSLELVLDPDKIVHARLTIDVTDLDIDVEAKVV
jgi:hypothetical protein